ncbi:MAG: metallophosphoesterase [Niastella sp.]|nr:metallophosphoesterase [Niastella sp.]
MEIDQQQVDELKQLIYRNSVTLSILQEILDFLPDCEYQLISFMEQQGVWQGPQPQLPPDFSEGTIELGLILYWLNNPAQIDLSQFSFKEQLAIITLVVGLDELLVTSKMTDENAAYFTNNELIYTDGSVLSTKTYATYDQGWLFAFLNLIESVTRGLWYNGGVFPATKPPRVPLKGAIANTVSIAILGDWGTGDATAKAVMSAVTALKPDYIVHVGDVYYAGTPLATSPNSAHYFAAGEETGNLLNLWPSSYAGRSFTLNSNHEMYSGANGYFYEALKAQVYGAGSFFSAQEGSSCFTLQYGGWTILGLDTAFMSSCIDAFMTGSIGGSAGTQGQWIQSLGLDPAKTIVLTHHNGFAPDCSAASPLWAEIRGALKGDPFAWYWGHVHNGIVYNAPITIPSIPKQPGLTTNTLTRCLGHAALPYGLATLNQQLVAWNETNAQPAPSKELYNGFAILTLSVNSQNQVSGITENWYDLSPAKQPVWTKKLL